MHTTKTNFKKLSLKFLLAIHSFIHLFSHNATHVAKGKNNEVDQQGSEEHSQWPLNSTLSKLKNKKN